MKAAFIGWSVHLLTASGAVLALFALHAIQRDQWVEALLWLLAALLVDGIDGSLARLLRVRERLPGISGESLDLVVDYLTYVFVPVVFLLESGVIRGTFAWPLGGLILLSSLYVFSRADMKTDDGYFRGFPALWNVVAFYLYVLQLPGSAVNLVIAALVVLTFAPVHMVHPFRTRHFGFVPAVAAVFWIFTSAALLLPDTGAFVREILQICSICLAALLLGFGVWRTCRGP